MSIAIFLAATAIVAIAAALQAAAGMGMALIAAPLLALLDTHLVPVPMLVSVIALSAAVSWRERQHIDRGILPVALAGLLNGCCIGAALLVLLQDTRLDRLFAVLILTAVALSLSGVSVPASRLALLLGGTAAGILGTVSGAQGPPIAIVLQHLPPARLRATLCAFFSAGGAVTLLVLGIGGLIDRAAILTGIALLPGALAGLLIAPPLSRRLDRQRARWAVLGLSAASAILLLLR